MWNTVKNSKHEAGDLDLNTYVLFIFYLYYYILDISGEKNMFFLYTFLEKIFSI